MENKGRPVARIFATPDDLQKAVDKYVEHCKTVQPQLARCITKMGIIQQTVDTYPIPSISDFCYQNKIDRGQLVETYLKISTYTPAIKQLYDFIYTRADFLHANGFITAKQYELITRRNPEYQPIVADTQTGGAALVQIVYGKETDYQINRTQPARVDNDDQTDGQISFADDDDKTINL